ncbi:hypothetical protein BGX30_002459, partial [Mortierella sp. GBA39]
MDDSSLGGAAVLIIEQLELNSVGLSEFAYGAQQFFSRMVSRFEELEYLGFDQSRRELNLDVAFSRLKRFIYLTLDGNDTRDHDLRMLKRLDFGLEQLSPPRRLVSLRLDTKAQDLSKKDVEWMLNHWPLLELIKGGLSQERKFEYELN